MGGNVLDTSRNSGRANALFEFTQGIEVDRRLAACEIQVQLAWAHALQRADLLSADETGQAESALREAASLIGSGRFEWRIEDEDVHMNLERFITERHGALGKKIHRGRSRNDLIATTLRLFVHQSLGETVTGARAVGRALTAQAERQIDVLVPGLTHLQHGQPIRLGHALAAHAWALTRDLQRLEQAAGRALEAMPLGSGALSGTTLPLDLSALARELGFRSPPLNSYDAVGDRDFMIEGLHALSLCALHLSRFSEDVIFMASTSVGLLKLPREWSTGSSLMPNKRNPDVAELTRGKSAHVLGAANEAHLLVKAQPSSYNSDLHELKSVYLRAHDELSACLGVLPPFIEGLGVDAARARELLSRGQILSTELADDLCAQGLPFREAYAQVADYVERAEARGTSVESIAGSPLTPETAVERRTNSGGSARARVTEQLAILRERFA